MPVSVYDLSWRNKRTFDLNTPFCEPVARPKEENVSEPITFQMKQALRPDRLLPSLTAGLVAGILIVSLEISFAALIFSGDLDRYISKGVGLTLFATCVIGLVTALGSSFPAVVSLSQDVPAAIMAVGAASIAGRMPGAGEGLFATVVAAIAVTSLLTGAFFLVMGRFKLGGLVRYMPYPVVGGFLAGTGWLLVSGSMSIMTDVPLDLAHLDPLFQPHALIQWLPGLIFAVLLTLVLRRYSHFLIIPAALLSAIALFYVLLWLTQISVAEATTRGLLLGSFPGGGLWQPLTLATLRQVEWPVLFAQASSMGTVVILSAVSLLLNASGVELATRQEIDLNRELVSTGLANLLAGLGGGLTGYPALSLSALGCKMGANSRLVGIFSSALCGAMLLAGGALLSFFPRFILGGLVFFLGLSFLVEWVYDAWFKLSKPDYGIVLLILVTIGAVGVLEGVGLGLALAVVLFIVNYSRIGVVKHALSGTSYQSNVERSSLYHQLLKKRGAWLYILELQGFVFFGTANKLLDQVRQRLDAPDRPMPRFILFDFRQVNGLDASAVLSFVKIKQQVQAQDIMLIFTHLSPPMTRQLERQVLTHEDQSAWRTFPDLDHGVEWCEEQIIQDFESVGLSDQPRTARRQLGALLSSSDKLAHLFEHLAPQKQTRFPALPDELDGVLHYMEEQDVEQGQYLIRQGEKPAGLYFVAEGQVTAQVEGDDGCSVRLRTLRAGTVVGEMGLYLGTPASASVVAEQPSVVFYLSTRRLEEIEETAPHVTAALHKFIAQLQSERLASANDTLRALLR